MMSVMQNTTGSNYDYLDNNCASTVVDALEAADISDQPYVKFLPTSVRKIGMAQPDAIRIFIPESSPVSSEFQSFKAYNLILFIKQFSSYFLLS